MGTPDLRRHGRLLLAVCLLLAPVGLLAQPQPAPFGLRAQLLDAVNKDPVRIAIIQLDGRTVDAAIGEDGRFTVIPLAAGRHELLIRAVGYTPFTQVFEIADGVTLEAEFHLNRAEQQLTDIEVEARAARAFPRFADFERRRERGGMGHFITREEIRNRGYLNLSDALRTIKGIRLDCSRIECQPRFSGSAPNCKMAFWIDGVFAPQFGATTPIMDVYGIEVYRGASDAPAEFAGSNAGCRVVAIWTRVTP